MPTIPAVTLGTGVDIDTVYDGNGAGGLFEPRVTPDTAEILNGGLDQVNYSGGTNSIPAEAFQSGCFARGLYTGFDRFEFHSLAGPGFLWLPSILPARRNQVGE